MTKKVEAKVEVEEVAVIIDIAGLSKDNAMTKLIATYGKTFSEANEYWADNRPTRGTGFASRFYAILEKGDLSEADFDGLLAVESTNVKNHRSHYNSIRELANIIWAAKIDAETGE
jgi:hypothetical protein